MRIPRKKDRKTLNEITRNSEIDKLIQNVRNSKEKMAWICTC